MLDGGSGLARQQRRFKHGVDRLDRDKMQRRAHGLVNLLEILDVRLR